MCHHAPSETIHLSSVAERHLVCFLTKHDVVHVGFSWFLSSLLFMCNVYHVCASIHAHVKARGRHWMCLRQSLKLNLVLINLLD